MEDELVLLTSYFNLANGRRQDTADTFRVDPSLPSRTSPDGTAALYVITESSAGGHMGPRARRLAADTIAWEYSAHGEDPPAKRLKAALRAAHEEVQREFDGHVTVGASIIAVEHRDVYLAQVAPAQVYVLHEGSLHSISLAATGSSPFAEALGAGSGPRISVYHDQIESGDVLALCASWFNRTADPEDLRECFGAGTADDIAESLLELGRQHDVRDATVIVIEIALASELEAGAPEDAPGFVEQVDIAVQALASVGRMLWSELKPQPAEEPTNGHVALTPDPDDFQPRGQGSGSRPVTRRAAVDQSTEEFPQVDAPEPTEPWNPESTAAYDLRDLQANRPVRRTVEQPTEEVSALQIEDDDDHRPAYDLLDREPRYPAPDRQFEAADEDETLLHPADAALDTEADEQSHAETQAAPISELDVVNSRLHHGPDMSDVIPPVQGFPDTSVEPSRIYATSRDIQAVNRRPRRFGGIARPSKDPSAGATVVRPSLSDIDLRRPVGRPAPPALIWLTIAVVGVFAIFAAYKFLQRNHHPAAVVNPYPAAARKDIRLAQAAGTPAQQDTYLARARHDITLARQAGDKPADLRKLNQQYQIVHDTIFGITRETTPVRLATFTQPTEMAINSESTLFVLDAGKKGVYAVTPNTTSSPTEDIQANEQDSGLTIGTPQHVATSQSTALVLDDQNQLIRDTGGNKTAVRLVAPSSQTEKIVAMANFGTDIYLLDAAGNQIWRYPDAVASDSSSPTGFLSNSAADLGQPVSLALDDKDIYVLKSTGQILKFDNVQATAQPFSPGTLRIPLKGANSIFTDVGLPYIWVADPGNGRIVQLNKTTGKYVRSYMAPISTGLNLRKVIGMAVPTTDKTLYVLAGTQLYSFPITP
jgi:hypothetical protein